MLGTHSSQSMAGGAQLKNNKQENISRNNFMKNNRRLEYIFTQFPNFCLVQHEKLKQKFSLRNLVYSIPNLQVIVLLYRFVVCL